MTLEELQEENERLWYLIGKLREYVAKGYEMGAYDGIAPPDRLLDRVGLLIWNREHPYPVMEYGEPSTMEKERQQARKDGIL